MSNIWSKLVTGFIVLLVAVCLITAIRTDLLSDGAAYEIFISALDCFPFAQTMANIANKICGSQVLVGLNMRSVVSELTTLFGMAVICPVVMGAANRIFLKMPAYTDWYDRERYMQTWSYRLKSALLNVVMMPACTLITMVLLDSLLALFKTKVPFLHTDVIALIVLVVAFGASLIIQMLERPERARFLIRHRLVMDLLGSLLKIVGMNQLCFCAAAALLADRNNAVLGYILALIVYLAGLDFLLKSVLMND